MNKTIEIDETSEKYYRKWEKIRKIFIDQNSLQNGVIVHVLCAIYSSI